MKEADRIVKKFEAPGFIIGIRDDGIMHVYYKSNTLIDVGIQSEVRDAAFALSRDKKMPCIFEAGDYVTLTKEARANAKANEEDFPSTASAVIVQNLAYKMVADFYFKMSNPKQPFKVFKKIDEAVEWLKELRGIKISLLHGKSLQKLPKLRHAA